MGNNDVFVVPATGGEPRQLTFTRGDDESCTGRPTARQSSSRPAAAPNPWGSPLYVVPLDGTLPMPLRDGLRARRA